MNSSDPEEPASASPSKKRPRVDTAHASATHAAEVDRGACSPLPELRGPAALPPPDLDGVPSLPPPGLDKEEEAASTGAAPKCVRQFEHVDGQFATHVYLPVAAGPSLRRDIDGHTACLVAPSRARGERSNAAVHAIAAAEYHLSLSRTCVLLQPQLAAFTEALRLAYATQGSNPRLADPRQVSATHTFEPRLGQAAPVPRRDRRDRRRLGAAARQRQPHALLRRRRARAADRRYNHVLDLTLALPLALALALILTLALTLSLALAITLTLTPTLT